MSVIHAPRPVAAAPARLPAPVPMSRAAAPTHRRMSYCQPRYLRPAAASRFRCS